MALTAGLLLGLAMQPNLRADPRPEGPQILAGESGVRSTGRLDSTASFTAYSGAIPDYVLGTDWQSSGLGRAGDERHDQPTTAPAEALDFEVSDEPAAFTLAGHADAPQPAPSYPSLNGGVAYGEGSLAEAAAPTAPAPSFDDDAPAQATGDTSQPRG